MQLLKHFTIKSFDLKYRLHRLKCYSLQFLFEFGSVASKDWFVFATFGKTIEQKEKSDDTKECIKVHITLHFYHPKWTKKEHNCSSSLRLEKQV